MSVTVGGLTLANPVLAASGTFGYGREYASHLTISALGGLVTKGVSLAPRAGNVPPRICETACGMLNAIGLANVGLEAFLRDKLPFLTGLKAEGLAVVVNLYAESVAEFAELAGRLAAEGAAGVSALEVNVSCPNVKGGGMVFGVDPVAVAEVTRAVVAAASSLPVWVKLTPNVADPVPLARAALGNGAQAVSLINTLLGMAINARVRRPRLANLYGGLSGPVIKPVGLRMVHQVARAIPDAHIVGLGGVMSGEDAAEYMLAGARAVQVGTASFVYPGACARVVAELAAFCREQNIADVGELTGGLKA
jgi:dihydroorotate dehydrogenase (NAD+) catalytic subunit